METLGVSFEDLDFLFFSHLHLDHVGGMREYKNSQFSISRGPVELPAIPTFAPTKMEPSSWNPGPKVKVIREPEILAEGIASIGAKDVTSAIAAIQAVDPAFVSLSPHDSSDWSLAQFKDAFGDRYHELKVGRELQLPQGRSGPRRKPAPTVFPCRPPP